MQNNGDSSRSLVSTLVFLLLLSWPLHGALLPNLRALSRAAAEGPVLRLSDLLPASAALKMRLAAENIALGPSPKLGSARILGRSEIYARLRDFPQLLGAISFPAQILVERKSVPVSPEQVHHAVAVFANAHGWQLPSEQTLLIEVPSGARALNGSPALEILSLRWDTRRQAVQARLRCREESQCSPFFAWICVPREMVSLWGQHLGIFQDSLLPTSANSETNKVRDGPTARKPRGTALVQAGSRAIVVMRTANIRITVPVICLQRGALAQYIRVRPVKGQKVFDAEVTGAGLLQASF